MTIRSIGTVRGPQLVAGGPTTFITTAPFAPRSQLATSSNSTATLSTGGPLTFAVQTAGFSIAPGQRVRVSVDGSTTEWMEGIVTAFDGVTVTFDPDTMAGTGTYSDWNIGVAGERGAQGAAGPQGPAGPQGIIAEAPTDAKYYARRSGGWSDIGLVYSKLDSPAFINVPTAPTPPNATNTTQIATTAFVKATSQPLDADLTALAAVAGVNVIYYRSAADTWSAITIGTGLSFTGGTLANVASGGNVTAVGTPTNGQVAVWTGALTIQGLSPTAAGIATLDSPIFTGDARAITPPTSDNDTTVATTAYVKANLATYQPYDGDLVALAAVTDVGAIIYRSGNEAWSPVTIQSPLAFSGGVLSTLAGGGNVVSDSSPTNGQLAQWLSGTQVKGVDAASFGFAPIAGPNFTGSPTAPTPSPLSDSTSKLATTQFVQQAIAAAAGFTTGDVKFTLKLVADAGWVMMDNGTIGSAASGSTYANAAAQALFILLFNNITDAWCPVFTLTGVATNRAAYGNSAASAWSANGRMSLPKVLGRALAVAASGGASGFTTRALGETFGSENSVASHAHVTLTVGNYTGTAIGGDAGAQVNAASGTTSASTQTTGTVAGNVPPTVFLNVMIKL